MKSVKLNTRSLLFYLTAILLISIGSCKKEGTAVEPKNVEQHRQELSTFISSEKKMVSNCKVGYNKGDFFVSNGAKFTKIAGDYLNVLNAAESVVQKEAIQMEDIVAAYKSFGTPGQSFYKNLYISDRSSLNSAIEAAQSLYEGTPAGTSSGQASPEAREKFATAISTAKNVRDSETAIERQVAAADTALSEAKKEFEAAIR